VLVYRKAGWMFAGKYPNKHDQGILLYSQSASDHTDKPKIKPKMTSIEEVR
jgi:hypothetical protein